MNQAINQTSYYTAANLIRRMASLIMLPIYTRYLTPEDYGVIELMSIALDLVGILVCNRIGEAIYRYYFMAKDAAEKAQTISTAFSLAILINFVGFLVLLLVSKPVSDFITPEPDFHRLFVLFAVTLIFEAIVNIPIIYLRIHNMAKYYLLVSVIKLAIQLSLNIYFVVILDLHVAGVVYSALISNAIMGFILGAYFLSKNGLHFKIKIAYKIVTFSIPMIFVATASFVTTFGDRYFLKLYSTLDDVGIYSLAYKFGFLFMTLSWDPFFKYWEGQRYRVYESDDAQDQFAKSFVYVSLWLISLGTLISVFLGDLLVILSDEKFHSAAEYAPIIILAYIFYAWGYYCDFGIFLKEKTKYLAYTEVVSAILILLLYFALIPKYGVFGAATATAIGYFLRFLILKAVSFSLYPMHLPWLRVSTILAICAISSQFIVFEGLQFYVSIPLKIFAVSVLFTIIYNSSLVRKSERSELKDTLTVLIDKFANTFNRR